jgi:hypothetical protein
MSKCKLEDRAGVMIPAGLLVGIGYGMLTDNVAAYTLIGLGAGFLGMALMYLFLKK